jgi:hypothetical protein
MVTEYWGYLRLLDVQLHFPMSLVYALLGGLSIGEVVGGVVMLFISLFAVFFWGSGLSWREPKKDRRIGL